jgi:hypothetical protein
MHILKCKQEENRNKILRNRIFIKKQSQSNPHLEDIVNRYDDYYEEFKKHLLVLKRILPTLDIKSKNEAEPGMEYDIYIQDAINSADLMIVFLSAYYLGSGESDFELKNLLERAHTFEGLFLPIIIITSEKKNLILE